MPPRKRLGQLLTELGVVDEHQLQSALGHQKQWGGKLGAVLVQKGFCKESEVVIALSKHLGMPAVKLAEATIDPRAVKFVSKQIAEKLHVFPYEISGTGRSEVVTIAMSDPTDLSAVDQLAFHTGKRIKPMLAGDSEIVNAIQEHYADEKKPAAAPVAGARPAAAAPVAAPAPPSSEFPRRVSPPAAVAPAAGTLRPTPAGGTPYIPPPIPVMAPKPAQKLEEIEPDESMSVPAKPEPLDLPPDDGQVMGLEPIAAHSQFGDQVAGQEEVAGEGTAADALEGFESAGVPHEGADAAAQMEGLEPVAAHAQVPAPEGGWGEAAPVEGWQAEAPAAAEGWSDEAPADPAAHATANDFGAAQDWSAAQEQAVGLGGEEPPAAPVDAAWGAEGWGSEPPAESAPTESPGEELPMDAIIGTADVAEGAPEVSPWGDAEPEGGPAPEQAASAETHEDLGHEEHAEPSLAGGSTGEIQIVADHQPSADAPDAWASSEDPIAAEAGAPAWGEAALPEQALGDGAPADNAEAGHVVAPSTDKFAPASAAAGAEQELAAAEIEAPPEWGDAPAEEAQPAAAGEGTAAPREESAAHPEEFAAPAEESAASREESAAPSEEFAAPGEEFAAPGEEFAAPSEESGAPAEESAAFRDESAAPSGEFAAPAEESAAPREESVALAEEFAEPSEEFAAPAEESAAPSEEFAPPVEESAAPGAEQGELRLEGWVAPPTDPEPEGTGWLGQALEATTPLSVADLGTLASIGVDPNDGVGALRLLATFVRVLHRHQLLDPDEVANEIRESHAEAAAEHAAAGRTTGPPAEPESPGEQVLPAEPAET